MDLRYIKGGLDSKEQSERDRKSSVLDELRARYEEALRDSIRACSDARAVNEDAEAMLNYIRECNRRAFR